MDPMLLLVILILVVVAALFPIVITLRLMCLACCALECYIEQHSLVAADSQCDSFNEEST